ncbi:MAG: Druantia anti-phage system protein DruA [Ginsengibacter sp.]
MEKEVINIEPKLSKVQLEMFLNFCKRVKKSVNRKRIDVRIEFLVKEKEEVNGQYSGKGFHPHTDLAFMENLILDLMLQDWELIVNRGKILLELETLDMKDKNLDDEKAKTRRRHLLARDVQLKETSVRDFIRGMEKRRLTSKGWQSIFSIMRDGSELKKLLNEVKHLATEDKKVDALNKIVRPYIQVVEPTEKCEQTGLALSDIWRYFRHTWINEYKSLPGRSMSILIRDAAAPNHPVIGIAALGSSVAQQTCRDEWIGWNGETFIERLKNDPSAKLGKWIIETLEMLLSEIYLKDFFKSKIISLSDIRNPSSEKIKELRELSLLFKAKHMNNPETAKFSVGNDEMSWSQRAETNLFKSKRATLLAELLGIKMMLNKYEFTKGTKKELERCLENTDFRNAVERLARKAKSIHVGINMMDIIVAGSVAPYNHLLGGKLVCMMLTSPELTQYYNEKYGEYVSLIASSMSGKALVRKPQLVMLGTTSLYGVGSSQYNRIKIPVEEIGGKKGHKIEYKELGFSEGFGSFHFSSNTITLADAVAGRESGRKRVNSIFGEGANPLIRKLKDAMEHLELESNPILNHRNKRVVYGIALAENFGDVLLGLAERPKYLIPQGKPKLQSELIGKYWIKRWLLNRIKNDEILEKVNMHSLSYPITHGARVPLNEDENQLALFNT